MTILSNPHVNRHSRIVGIGSARGNRVVTNDDLAKTVDTNDQWIRERVGIIERRLCDDGQSLVDLAVAAGANAIADAGLTPDRIGAVLIATCTMETTIPNASAQTATRLGVDAPGAFDSNAACAGFCYTLNTASDLVRGGTVEHVLVIGAEKFTDWIDWTDRSTCIIFGDGAGAAVVGPAERPGIGPVAFGSAGEHVDKIYVKDRRSYIFQEGQAVFRWATTRIAPVAMQAVKNAGLSLSDIDVFVPHQANLRIVENLAKKLVKAGAREDMVVADDIVYSGNTSSASIPLAVDRLRAAGRINSGDVMLFVGFGAGLTYAGQVVVCP